MPDVTLIDMLIYGLPLEMILTRPNNIGYNMVVKKGVTLVVQLQPQPLPLRLNLVIALVAIFGVLGNILSVAFQE